MQFTLIGVIDYQYVYVSEFETQQSLDRKAYDLTKTVLYPIIPKDCTVATLRLACTGTFLPCEYVPLEAANGATGMCSSKKMCRCNYYDDLYHHFMTLTVALPRPPCRSVCEDVVVACATTLQSAGKRPPDCTAINPASGQPVSNYYKTEECLVVIETINV
jgi:hypothetical protein